MNASPTKNEQRPSRLCASPTTNEPRTSRRCCPRKTETFALVELNPPTRAEGPSSNLEEASVGTKTLSPRPYHGVRQCLSLSTPQSGQVGLLLMLHTCASTDESVLEVEKESSVSALHTSNPTLSNSAGWMVLAALSAACSTGANLTSVSMTICSMAYHIFVYMGPLTYSR